MVLGQDGNSGSSGKWSDYRHCGSMEKTDYTN
jgi:hypothetical protein